MIKKPLMILESSSVEETILSNYIKHNFCNMGFLNILEAGCGRRWMLKLEGLKYVLTGVDINAKSLEIRKNEYNDLDEIIIGDLRTIELEKSKYHVIFNSFVLEHIYGAEKVLDNFFMWLKPNGVLILRIPDRNTVSGFITRFTPYKFHVFFKRYIFGRTNAGKPGYGPFPTFYDSIVSRKGIHSYCQKYHHTIIAEYGTCNQKHRHFKIIFKCFEILSLGRITSDYAILTFIIKKLLN
jgi:SAM-dependent methyltransferase